MTKSNRRSKQSSSRPTGSGGPPWVLIGGVAALGAVAAIVLSTGGTSSVIDPASEGEAAAAVERPMIETRPSSPKPPANAPLPPLPFIPAGVGPVEVINAAYEFAARNPDVLEYVPCFCGCETAGHTGNASCFVAARNADGTVREWDNHGTSCPICVNVARRAEQLHVSGASVSDIRDAVEAEYSNAPRMTPTPAPPAD